MAHPTSLKNVPAYNATDIMQLSSEDLANELAVLGETTSTVRLKAGTLRYSRIIGSDSSMHVSRTIDSKGEAPAVASREGDPGVGAARVDSTLQKNGASILLVDNAGSAEGYGHRSELFNRQKIERHFWELKQKLSASEV